ncbi:MAG: ribbon-helix-helix protein, CopG family [Acidobacteriota bacterium]|nr:ribbon-helix-helix protein, CopG family [Acidobacteriota bacterium]
MVKTTLYLEDSMMLRLKELARSEGRKQSSLVREALQSYLDQHQRPEPKGIGSYRSGREDISERGEELLAERPRPGSR